MGEHEDWCRLALEEEEKKTTRNVEQKCKKKLKRYITTIKQTNRNTATEELTLQIKSKE